METLLKSLVVYFLASMGAFFAIIILLGFRKDERELPEGASLGILLLSALVGLAVMALYLSTR